jgi:hypothetical protein
MEIKKHNCLICKKKLNFNARYPNYICAECSDKATESKGRKLAFTNTSFSGGFEAIYIDTKKITTAIFDLYSILNVMQTKQGLEVLWFKKILTFQNK